MSDDDSVGKVMTSLNEVEQVVVKVNISESDVNKLSAMLNGDGTESCIDTLVTSGQ